MSCRVKRGINALRVIIILQFYMVGFTCSCIPGWNIWYFVCNVAFIERGRVLIFMSFI